MSGEDPDDLDDLVPLYRRKIFDRDLGAASEAAHASGEPLALIMLDGDGFKQINDTHGHATGDEVLRALGELIRRRVKGKGRGYRFGGDEFGILLQNYSAKEALGFAEHLREEVIGESFGAGGFGFTITLGVACLPAHAADGAELFKKADAALYAAKEAGRNRVAVSGAGPVRVSPGSAGLAAPAPGADRGDIVLLSPPDGRVYFVPCERVETGDEGRLVLDVLPEDNRQASMLAELPTDRPTGIAYGLSALFARLESRTKTREKRQERWRLTFQEREADYGDSFMQEMAVGNMTGDQFAARRARRILLDEGGRRASDKSPAGLNGSMDEMFVRGFNTPIEIERSPFIDLVPILEADPDAFLRAARLVAVLHLCLSRAVEHVFRLDLSVDGRTLHVDFEGQRARRYSNEEPAVIRVSGTLDLGSLQTTPSPTQRPGRS